MIDDRLAGMKKQKKEPKGSIENHIVEGSCQAIIERYQSLGEQAKQKNFGELDKDIVVIDTETTGFSLNHDELIQIAAARMSGGEIIEWFITFVNPGKQIPEEIVHLTSITDEDVAEAPDAEEAVAQLAEFVGDSDLVAHNAEFDMNFVTKYRAGAQMRANTWIDSLDLARIALPRLKSHRLLDLVRTFDAPLSTHRADADVEALCVIYRVLLMAVYSMPLSLLDKIIEISGSTEWPTLKVFEVIGALKEDEEQLHSQNSDSEKLPTKQSFSLRAIRHVRLRDFDAKLKVDAEAIAQDSNRSLEFPEAIEIEEVFAPDGIVGALYENYETRDEQCIMAETVLQAFSSSTNLAVEAGTGVGKSMAYLVPAILTAKKNNISIGIATKTNTLLDQLVYKELPLLSDAINSRDESTEPVSYVSLKGFSHYICLRSVNQLIQDEAGTRTVAGKIVLQAPAIAALLSFIEQSEYDDIDSLKLDYRALPRYLITTSSHECLRRKCPFFGTQCFVHGARRRAESADIVVTNHSLLFCDIAADGGLLPAIRYWVVDEAHGTEAEARRAFSLTLSAEENARLVRKISSDEGSHNVFTRAERRASASLDEGTLFYALLNKARVASKTFEQASSEFFLHVKDLSFFDSNKKNKGYEFVELWINEDIRASETFAALVSHGRIFCDAIEKLITACQELVGILENVEEAAEVQREIATITMQLKETLNAAEVILFSASPNYAYSANLSKRKDRNVEKLEALLVSVGEKLNETLFTQTHSVVFTSATLTVADSFESFETALGMNESEFSRTATRQLESSYAFDENMTIYVANDIPEPNEAGYLAALQRLLILTHLAQQGSMLTLFTNRKEMEGCFDAVRPALKEENLRLVCQKWGVSPKSLRDDFLTDETLSLFALKSFWEGFDAPGATLKGVIIPKLPFAKPSDPLSRERALRDSQAWSHYVLPAAVLETKQAAGRLIRKSDDTGCLILADRRIVTKGYGKVFLRSMPSKTIKICSSAEIAEELAARRAK